MHECNDLAIFRPIFEILEGRGPLTSTGIEALLYMKTNNSVNSDPEHPDVELLQSFATVAFDTGKCRIISWIYWTLEMLEIDVLTCLFQSTRYP